ncbi:MAG: T9SS type A sorting domain-containing protein [Bacteroidales bacterium]
MKKQNFLFLMALLLSVHAGFTQTLVSGGIYANTTWTLANSPYLMTGSIVVFPGVTLTIQPGVEIRVKENGLSGGQYYLETRGTINMVGQPGAPITFRADTAVTTPYAWVGIVVKNSQGGAINYDYVSISNAGNAIAYDSFIPPLIILNQCVFNYNGYAINVGTELRADSCTFIGNNTVIMGWSIFKFTNCEFRDNGAALFIYASELMINNCSFTNNTLGINISSGSVNGINVKNTIFDNNDVAFDNPNNGVIDSCTFINNLEAIKNTNTVTISNSVFNNNQTALQAGWGTIVTGCEINNNVTGIALGPIGFGQPAPVVENNHICYNSDYNIDNRTDLNLFIPTNCFCTTDPAVLEEKILDGYDDITKGLVSYAIFDTTCTTVIAMVIKTVPTATNQYLLERQINIFPNPATTHFTISNQSPCTLFDLYDLQGQRLMSSNLLQGDNRVDISRLQAGAYYCRLTGENQSTLNKLIIKQ